MSYSVQVVVTSEATTYTLNIPSGDDVDGNVAPTYGLADPLTIKQSLPTSDKGIAAHPNPDEATLSVIAPDSTTYGFALGDPVSVKVYPQAAYAGTPATFYGRIATLSATPHDLGVQYSLGCLDYTADLAELPVGGTVDWPAEQAYDRVARIMAEAGLPNLARVWEQAAIPWLVSPTVLLAARTKSATDAYSALVSTLDSWALTHTLDEYGVAGSTANGHVPTYRARLIQTVTADLLDTTAPYRVAVGAPRSRRVRYAPPGRLTTVAGKRSVTVAAADSSPSTGAPILDGGRVEFAPTFTQTKGGGLANVINVTDAAGNVISYDWRANNAWSYGGPGTFNYGGPTLDLSGPATVQTIATLADPSDPPGGALMTYRVPNRPDLRNAWDAGTLTWEAWAEPTDWRRPDLTELLTVARAQTTKMPPNREWLVGLVSSTKLTVAGGRVVFDIELQPNTYDYWLQSGLQGASLGVARYDSPALAGFTYAQLSTRDTFTDYQIARGS